MHRRLFTEPSCHGARMLESNGLSGGQAMTVAARDVAQDYLQRVRQLPGVEAVYCEEHGDYLTFYVLIAAPERDALDPLFEADVDLIRAYPNLDLDFRVF